jgi:hypothetical protein
MGLAWASARLRSDVRIKSGTNSMLRTEPRWMSLQKRDALQTVAETARAFLGG